MADLTIVADERLRQSPGVREFIGADHGVGVCFILVDMAPGQGVRLHRHSYPEVFILQEGSARFRIGAETMEVQAPVTLVAPAGTPHAFTNTGPGVLRQVDIHPSPVFETEWLE